MKLQAKGKWETYLERYRKLVTIYRAVLVFQEGSAGVDVCKTEQLPDCAAISTPDAFTS